MSSAQDDLKNILLLMNLQDKERRVWLIPISRGGAGVMDGGLVRDSRRHEYQAIYDAYLRLRSSGEMHLTCGWCQENVKKWRCIEDIKPGDIIVGWMTTQESSFYEKGHRGNKRGIVSVGEVTMTEDIREQDGFTREYNDKIRGSTEGGEKWIHFNPIFSCPPNKPIGDLSEWATNTGITPLKKTPSFILDRL